MELGNEQLDQIVRYADRQSADNRIFINRELLPNDMNLYKFDLISSDVVKGVALLGEGFPVANLDVSYKVLLEEMNRRLDYHAIILPRKKDEEMAYVLDYVKGEEEDRMVYLWSEDESLIGKRVEMIEFYK